MINLPLWKGFRKGPFCIYIVCFKRHKKYNLFWAISEKASRHSLASDQHTRPASGNIYIEAQPGWSTFLYAFATKSEGMQPTPLSQKKKLKDDAWSNCYLHTWHTSSIVFLLQKLKQSLPTCTPGCSSTVAPDGFCSKYKSLLICNNSLSKIRF